MDQIAVTSQLTTVTGAGWEAGALIYNAGSAVIYATDTATNLHGGFPIAAGGGSLTWDAGRPLYLFTDEGQSSTAVVDETGGAYTSPGDLASAIIAQGLGPSIAESIALVGVPAIDAPETILSLNKVGAGSSWPSWPVACSKFQSVTFNFTVNLAPFKLSGAGDQVILTCTFMAPDGTVTGSYQLTTNGAGTIVGTGPVLGSTMFLQQPAGQSSNYIVSGSVIGSFRASNALRFSVRNTQWQLLNNPSGGSYVYDNVMDHRATSWLFPVPANTNAAFFPSYCSGPLTVSLSIPNTIAAGSVDYYLQSESSYGIGPVAGAYQIGATAYLSPQTFTPIYLGGSPPIIAVNNRNSVPVTVRGFIGG